MIISEIAAFDRPLSGINFLFAADAQYNQILPHASVANHKWMTPESQDRRSTFIRRSVTPQFKQVKWLGVTDGCARKKPAHCGPTPVSINRNRHVRFRTYFQQRRRFSSEHYPLPKMSDDIQGKMVDKALRQDMIVPILPIYTKYSLKANCYRD